MKAAEQLLKRFDIPGKCLIRTFICLIFIGISGDANAQNKWQIEARAGVNCPAKDLGDANLKTGAGFEGNVSYTFMQSLAVYGGWSWNRFAADRSFAGTNMDFEETGYSLGLQFFRPIGSSTVKYMVRGGATYNHIETENNKGEIIDDSGHGVGWQLGAGVILPLGRRLTLLPEIRYRSLSRVITIGNNLRDVDLNYFSGSIGLSWSF